MDKSCHSLVNKLKIHIVGKLSFWKMKNQFGECFLWKNTRINFRMVTSSNSSMHIKGPINDFIELKKKSSYFGVFSSILDVSLLLRGRY